MGHMSEALVIRRHGGPEMMVLEVVPVNPAGPAEILIRQSVALVNYLYLRAFRFL